MTAWPRVKFGVTKSQLVLPAPFHARTLDWKRTKEAVFLTAKTTAMVCWLFVGSALFSGVFAILGGQALLEETLIERYDVDWWRNPRAGPWICSALFGEGQRELAHEQAERVAGKALSFAPLVRSVERMLG